MSTTLSPDRLAAASRSAGPTFARRRLRLGITGVGGSVLLATGWLVATGGGTTVPGWLAGAAAPETPLAPLHAARVVATLLALHALLLLPVEFLGGRTLQRDRRSVAGWFAGWLRGVAVLLTLAAGIAAGATALLDLGAPWPLAVAAAALLLFAAQGPIARLLASLRITPADARLAREAQHAGVDAAPLRLVHAGDRGFVGGWVGLLAPTLWVPAHWAEDGAPADVLRVQLARRQAQRASGARWRGLAGAIGWTALGAALIAWALPVPVGSAGFFAAAPAAATLWAFVGVLLLPSLSRGAVFAADRAAAHRLGADAVRAAIAPLDRWQDDEPARSPLVETIFHPVPSRGRREAALEAAEGAAAGGAHQLTRLMLFAMLATGSPLGRVVHCNVGRPALWAVYPGD